jgi:hypothetical protein
MGKRVGIAGMVLVALLGSLVGGVLASRYEVAVAQEIVPTRTICSTYAPGVGDPTTPPIIYGPPPATAGGNPCEFTLWLPPRESPATIVISAKEVANALLPALRRTIRREIRNKCIRGYQEPPCPPRTPAATPAAPLP